MKCPDCRGTGEMPNDHIPIIKCKTCGGSGEVDKIRQLYIDSELLDIDEVDPVIIFTAGHKSRDEEIKKWKGNYMKLYEWIIARDLLGEYLEDFYEVFEEIT